VSTGLHSKQRHTGQSWKLSHCFLTTTGSKCEFGDPEGVQQTWDVQAARMGRHPKQHCMRESWKLSHCSFAMEAPPFHPFPGPASLSEYTTFNFVIESPTTPRYHFPHIHCYIFYLPTYLSYLLPTLAAGEFDAPQGNCGVARARRT
jgi:hypothetical protein